MSVSIHCDLDSHQRVSEEGVVGRKGGGASGSRMWQATIPNRLRTEEVAVKEGEDGEEDSSHVYRYMTIQQEDIAFLPVEVELNGGLHV